MNKIRVFYIIDHLATGAGTENQLVGLIRHLDRERFEPTLITLADFDIRSLPEHHDPTCRHISLGFKGKLISPNGISRLLRLARMIRRERVDIVHTYFLDSNIIGVLGGVLGRCKRIVVSRRDTGYWHTPRLLFFLRQINRLADYFLVNANAIKQTVARHEQFPADRIEVVHNGHFDLPADGQTPLERSEFGIPDDAPLVGIVANLRPVKRLDNFVRVASRISDQQTCFMIVGTGELCDDLLEQAQSAGLERRLVITHTLGNIYDYINMFDVGVLTSDSEGLSNTLIECQLCGRPAVAFDVGGNREVIEDGRTGYLVEPGDLEAMRQKIEALLADPSLRAKMGARASLHARRLFDGERMVELTADFYRRILGTKKKFIKAKEPV